MTVKATSKLINNILRGLLVFLLAISLFGGCENDEEEEDLIGNWYERSDFEGVPRSDAVAFTIGDKAYIGTGYDGTDRLNDFWEYDAARNNWTRKADFPGVPRNGAVGFGTSTKGYIGTGFDGVEKLKDFYEYDPVTDTWTQIEDFGGSARYSALAFCINDKGYVGTGYDDNALKDIWEYDPATGKWTKKTSLGGGKRRDAVAFVIDGKAYVCSGIDNGVYEEDFWEYDPLADSWSRKRAIVDASDEDYDDDYINIRGSNQVAFVINGKGYVASGGTGSAGTSVWEYHPGSDLWFEKTPLEAYGRVEAVGFAIGDVGYVALGRSGSYYFDDIWGLQPNVEQVDNIDEYILSENHTEKTGIAN